MKSPAPTVHAPAAPGTILRIAAMAVLSSASLVREPGELETNAASPIGIDGVYVLARYASSLAP